MRHSSLVKFIFWGVHRNWRSVGYCYDEDVKLFDCSLVGCGKWG